MYEPDLVYKIRGIVFDIYNNVVGDWAEEVYENIMFDALTSKGLGVERQKEFEIFYKGNRVGLYRTDLIVEGKIILELKAVPEILTLHQAQVISYLKVTGLALGILVNFGGEKLFIRSFPNNMNCKNIYLQESNDGSRIPVNKYSRSSRRIPVNKYSRSSRRIPVNKYSCSSLRCLDANFDINKVNLPDADKQLIQPYLMMGKEILEILGPGYFHRIYRRSFWDELKMNDIDFDWIKQLQLTYEGKVYGEREVRFFKVDDLLVSIVAVNKLDQLALHNFFGFVKHYKCRKGLIINFNNTIVDFKFVKIDSCKQAFL